MLRPFEAKLYPTDAQAETLSTWLRECQRLYNRALDHRIKAWKRRAESVGYNRQTEILTRWRATMPGLREVPAQLARDALRRVDRGFRAFFRRVKAGEKAGFPRFRARDRYNSMEQLAPGRYVRTGARFVPGIGMVRAKGRDVPAGAQKVLRVIRRASGWYAQVLVDDGLTAPAPVPTPTAPVGIDLGLTTFAALSTGELIPNPRHLARAGRKLRSAQRRLARRVKGSHRRWKAKLRLRRVHEKVAAQRRSFCHEVSTDIVRRFDLIAIENLNIKGLARSRLAKSVNDAGWSTFTAQLVYKAESAGRRVVKVDPRGTSQTCPGCGAVKAKELSERAHRCGCGCVLDRDVASARVILARASGDSRSGTPVEGPDLCGVGPSPAPHAGPAKREVCFSE